MKLAPVKKRVVSLFSAIFKPRPPGTISDWASGRLDGRPNVILSTKESGDFAGPYDPDLNPLPTILFEVFQSGLYRKFVAMKSSQSGMTLAVLILICYYAAVFVRNFLYVIDSLDEMRRVSQERIRPMLLACRAAGGQIPEKEGDLKTLTLSLRGCVGYLAGAQSLGALSNKSVGLAVFDEVDAFPTGADGAERATDLGAERGKKQSSFFEVLLSKPIEWDGAINQEYLIGTRHHCLVPCPHCGTFQTLDFERLEGEDDRDESGAWDLDRVLTGTFFRCVSEDCQAGPEAGKIWEHHKPEMIRRRRWDQTNFGKDEHKPQPGVFSCLITDMYSTFPTATWGILRREWCESELDDSKRQKFLRGRLARPRERKRIQARESDLWNMVGEYRRGECPVEPDVVVMFADVQEVVKKWVKCGFLLADDSCFVIDWGETLSYGDLITAADVPVNVLAWRPETPPARRVPPVVYKGLIDEGFRQKESRTFAVSTLLPRRLADGSPDFRFFTSWGQGGMHARHLADLVVPRLGDSPNVTHNGFPFFAYRFSDDNFKDELYNKRIGGARERRAALAEGRTPQAGVAPLWFPADMTPDFAAELCQERYEWNPRRRRWEWPECKNPNDYGDGVKGCLVEWYLVKPALALAAAERAKPAPPVAG